jgi:Rrf2 family iron-sulfur cluster assembly transcriptional regulator
VVLRYGKQAQQAVAAMSFLAERWASGAGPAASAEVGRARGIPAPIAAKLLSEISAGGYLIGTTGPGGGYRLARPPSEITLGDIVWLFERQSDEYPCPFGPGWCATNNPCPLHDKFVDLGKRSDKFLEATTFAVFARGRTR